MAWDYFTRALATYLSSYDPRQTVGAFKEQCDLRVVRLCDHIGTAPTVTLPTKCQNDATELPQETRAEKSRLKHGTEQ